MKLLLDTHVLVWMLVGGRRLSRPAFHLITDPGNHVFETSNLPHIHRDPFDRILITQAIVEGMTLLTADDAILQYPGPILKA